LSDDLTVLVNADALKIARSLLDDVEAGRVEGVSVVTHLHDGSLGFQSAGAHPFSLIGGMVYLALQIASGVDSAEDEGVIPQVAN